MTSKYLIASAFAGAALLASPAYADSDREKSEHLLGFSVGSIIRAKHEGDRPLRSMKASSTVEIHGSVTAINGTVLTVQGKNAAMYTVSAANASIEGGSLSSIAIGDRVEVKGEVSGTVIVASKIEEKDGQKDNDEKKPHKPMDRQGLLRKLDELRLGVVTDISSGVLTVRGFGATSTVHTDSSTEVKTKGKNASGTIEVGSRVLISGTTTASGSAQGTFTADVVYVIGRGFGWLKHFVLGL